MIRVNKALFFKDKLLLFGFLPQHFLIFIHQQHISRRRDIWFGIGRARRRQREEKQTGQAKEKIAWHGAHFCPVDEGCALHSYWDRSLFFIDSKWLNGLAVVAAAGKLFRAHIKSKSRAGRAVHTYKNQPGH
jgi:hypothetical protein